MTLWGLLLRGGWPHRRHVAVAVVVGVQGRDLDRRAAMRGMNELAVAGIDADMGDGAAVAEEDEVSALEVAAPDRRALARHVVRHARDALSKDRAVEVVDKAAAVEAARRGPAVAIGRAQVFHGARHQAAAQSLSDDGEAA